MFQHFGCSGAGFSFDAHIILNSSGDAGQVRNFLTLCNLLIHPGSRFKSRLVTGGKVGMNIPFHSVTVSHDFLRQFYSGDFLLHQLLMEFMNRITHSISSLNNLGHFEIAVLSVRRVHQCFLIGK